MRRDTLKLLRIAFALSMMLTIPASARANFFDWLQEMSGPGPFDSKEGAYLFTLCPTNLTSGIFQDPGLKAEPGFDKKPCVFLDRRNLKYDGKGEFPAAVGLLTYDAGLAWRMASYRRLSIGVGVGTAKFTGRGDVKRERLTLTLPRVEAMPLALLAPLFFGPEKTEKLARSRWLRVVKYHAGFVFIPGSVDSTTFGVPMEEKNFSRGHEFLFSRGVFIDFGELVRRY